jgi:Zn-dependent protease with chaperone function
MRAPRPARIDIVAAATASAHVDNGGFGLLRRRLVLTIGLPLARSLDLRQFTGVLAHELGHFTQGSSMRLSYVVHNVNRWFARMAWGRSGIDDMVDGMINPGEHSHWILFVIGLLCKLVIGVARLTLKLLAIVSHALTMNLSRQDEYDADWQAARIVGGETMGQALEATPFIDAAFTLAIERARLGWTRRQLPDDLVAFTRYVHKQLPTAIKDKIAAALLTTEASWFDTHPPLYQRVAAMKKSKLQGVLRLNARATCLFREFDELSKIATIDLYQSILGNALQPEHLVEVKLDAPPAPSTAAAPARASA